MPYLIMNSLYPSDKASDVVKRYVEALKKYPPDENLFTLAVPVAGKATHQGMQAIVVAEIKPGKLDEAYMYFAKMMAMFQDIQGYEYRIDPYVTVNEAFQIAGMSLPT
jgi:hypothetical protein